MFDGKIKGVYVHSENISDKAELGAYVQRGIEKYGKLLNAVKVTAEGEEALIEYDTGKSVPFQRIRRITGYLVGGMERWNNAKKSEEGDRVKHGLNEEA